jgi:hypothetical protein
VPEWAPPGQNHLLGTSSVVTRVNYDSNSVSYTTFDSGSTETLRLAFTPTGVLVDGAPLPQRSDLTEPGWCFTASNGVLRLRHDTGISVQIVASVPMIILTNIMLYSNSLCFSWNSASGAQYLVQGKVWPRDSNWVDVLGSITATGAITTCRVPLPTPYQYFRVK